MELPCIILNFGKGRGEFEKEPKHNDISIIKLKSYMSIINKKSKLINILVLALIALVLCFPASINPMLWAYFPSGLFTLFGFESSPESEMVTMGAVAGWIGYIVLIIIIFSINDDKQYKYFFYALTFIVILNCIGCQIAISAFASRLTG